jgi:hypothetical protein
MIMMLKGLKKVVLVIEAYFLNGDNATCNVEWKHDYKVLLWKSFWGMKIQKFALKIVG